MKSPNLTEWKLKISRNETLKSHGMGLANRRNLSIGSVVFGIGLPLALEPSTNADRDINSKPANAHPAWIVTEDPVNSLFFVRWSQRRRKIVPKLCWIQTPCRTWWENNRTSYWVNGFPKALILKARFPILAPNEIQFHPQRRIKISLEARVGAVSKIDQGVRPVPNDFKLVMQGIRIGS